jgi:hypothetical protein
MGKAVVVSSCEVPVCARHWWTRVSWYRQVDT